MKSRTRHTLQRVLKTAFFLSVLITTFLGGAAPSYAQSNQYGEYADLFNKTATPIASKLNILKKFDPVAGSATAVTLDLQFQFISSFDLSKGGGSPKKWHWDRIEDFLGGGSAYNSKVFLLRICDTDVPNEASCYFSVIPHATHMQGDAGPNGNSLFCPNGVCVYPDQSIQAVGKIYHYTQTPTTNNSSSDTIQNDKFNVLFNVPSVSTLSTSDTLSPAVSLNTIMHLGDHKNYQASVWYCAQKGDSDLPTTDNGSNIRMFNNLCGGGRPYFKIVDGPVFQLPDTAAQALNETAAPAEQVDTSPQRGDGLPECSMSDGNFGSGSFMGCIARLVYYVVYWPVAMVARLLGGLFDFFLSYSLDDASYRAGFAVRGWEIVRDISNIFFILILVWTGLSAVFTGDGSMKKVVPALILNALIINFSLFGTRVIIDVTNIGARVFYNTMDVCNGKCVDENPHDGQVDNPRMGPGNSKPLSEKIVSAFNPQKIFSKQILDSAQSTKSFDQNRAAMSDNQIAGYFIIVSIIAAFILFGIAKMFWKTAFFFLGRVIGLYMGMIFAPFAFLSKDIPLFNKFAKKLAWGEWVSNIVNYALLAPIFVFFLYIIYAFLDSDFITVYLSTASTDFVTTVIYIAIPMLIVYLMIDKGVSIASSYAGDIGKKVQDFAQKATGAIGGAALGVASGGIAFAGTRLADRFKLDETQRARLMEERSRGGIEGRIASMRLGLNDKAQTGSFDFRKTNAYTKVSDTVGKFGVKLQDNITKSIGLDSDATKGGIAAIKKAEDKKNTDKIESIKTGFTKDTDAEKYWQNRVRLLAQQDAHDKRIAELREGGKSEKEIKEMQRLGTFTDASYEKYVTNREKELKDKYGDIKTNKALTQALRAQFAETIQNSGTLGQQFAQAINPFATAGGVATTAGVGVGAGIAAGASTGGILGAIGYEQYRQGKAQRDNAEKYLKGIDKKREDQQKGKFSSKEERIENEKKKIESQLDEMNAHLKTTTDNFGAFFDEMIERGKAGEKAFAEYATKSPGSYDAKTDLEKTMQLYKRDMRAKMDALQLDIDQISDEYQRAKRAGRVDDANKHMRERGDLMMQKSKIEQDLLLLNDERRSRFENDLTKKENELDKIKEKNEKK